MAEPLIITYLAYSEFTCYFGEYKQLKLCKNDIGNSSDVWGISWNKPFVFYEKCDNGTLVSLYIQMNNPSM